jgi:hypothetical protein
VVRLVRAAIDGDRIDPAALKPKVTPFYTPTSIVTRHGKQFCMIWTSPIAHYQPAMHGANQ